MENILVSACLLGECCRYDGKSKPNGGVIALQKKYRLIPVCPECLGGLQTPRPPAEICGGRVCTKDGTDVTAQYILGAERTLEAARLGNCRLAVLKEKSPSCGMGKIYDGSFSAVLTDGNGIAAELLLKNGITVIGETAASTLVESSVRHGASSSAKGKGYEFTEKI